MDYQKALQYLDLFINYETRKNFRYHEVRLDRVRNILKLLNNPQNCAKAIHVAGTKGKGSTASFISSILRNAGYKVGLYTSPHLHDFRERIKVNDRLINKKDMVYLIRRLKMVIDEYINKTGDLPTFFEAYTALAFCYFRLKKVDFMVIEAGLGGRIDATNVIKPLVCVITPISHEHMSKLGRTLSKIAWEKAGIIKKGSSVVVASQPKVAEKVIRKKVRSEKAKLFMVGKNINYELLNFNGKHQHFRIAGLYNTYENLKSSLLGRHQVINAACSIAAIESLRAYRINISSQAIRKGIRKTKWPGRLEVVSQQPTIVLDGAQNRASAKVLKKAIEDIFDYEKLILVLGMSRDKDIKGVSSKLGKISNRIILTQALHPRAASLKRLKKYTSNQKPVHLRKDLKEAIKLAKKKAGKKDLVLITGSLFVVAEARALIKAIKNDGR
jgi:dihydrofolate synthase/folylpolyglutamate synthase